MTSLTPAPYYVDVAGGPEPDAHWVSADDGLRLRIAHWASATPDKGTIFLFLGRTENLEKYGPVVADLHRRGYAILGMDWRGQGLSDRLTGDRRMGHIVRFLDYQKDVAAMKRTAERLALPRPWFLLGHSMGACIGLRALIEAFPATACAFTAPMWGIHLPLPKRLAAWPLSWLAQAAGRGDIYAPGTSAENAILHTAFEDNRLTQDADMYRFYIKVLTDLPDQAIGGPSMGWLFETLTETRALSRLRSPDIPCLTFRAADDVVVDNGEIERRMASWPKGTLEQVQRCRHDILCETPDIRERVLRQVDAFFANAAGIKGCESDSP